MLTSQVLGTRFQEVLLTAPSASLWAPWFLRMLEGQGKPAVPDRGRFSKQQVAPRMPRDEIAGSSVTRGPQCHCLLCPHKERGASSFLTPRLCPASWKPWHKPVRCRPHYVSKESYLSPGAGLGVQGTRGLVPLRSFVLDQHIPNTQLSCHLYALLQGGQKGVKTGNPSVGGGVGGFSLQPLPRPLAVSVMPFRHWLAAAQT